LGKLLDSIEETRSPPKRKKEKKKEIAKRGA